MQNKNKQILNIYPMKLINFLCKFIYKASFLFYAELPTVYIRVTSAIKNIAQKTTCSLSFINCSNSTFKAPLRAWGSFPSRPPPPSISATQNYLFILKYTIMKYIINLQLRAEILATITVNNTLNKTKNNG